MLVKEIIIPLIFRRQLEMAFILLLWLKSWMNRGNWRRMFTSNPPIVISISTVCHLNSCKKGIPYAQALRLRRICSKETFFERRVRDLCGFLVERGYEKNFIKQQVGRARDLEMKHWGIDQKKKIAGFLSQWRTIRAFLISGACWGSYIRFFTHRRDAGMPLRKCQGSLSEDRNASQTIWFVQGLGVMLRKR